MLAILLMLASSGAVLILSNENTRCCHSKVRSFNGTMSPEPPWDRQSNVLRHRLVAQGGRLGAVLRGGVVEYGRVASYAEHRMVCACVLLKAAGQARRARLSRKGVASADNLFAAHLYQLFEDSVEGSRWVPSALPGYAYQVHRRSGVTWLVAPGLAMIAVTYGLARFAYGLFLPEMRESLDLSATALGLIGAGSYAGYCLAIVVALVFTSRTGPRFMAVAAGAVAVVGMAVVAGAPAAWVLAVGIVVAGSSSGLASPPMGEAVVTSIREGLQDRANALINSGTSIGVALSGPAALMVLEQWRIAWGIFALVGGAVVVWNAIVMPRKKPVVGDRPNGTARTDVPRLSVRYLVGPRSVPLLAAATGVGFASAVYWTFSRDLIMRAGDLSMAGSTLFWTVIGVSGLAGGLAGDLVRRFGLVMAFRASLLGMAAAIGLLAAAPGALLSAYLSGALFGSTYIMLTGIILIWSVSVFHERPSAGLGAAFLLIAVGQVFGAPIAGALAGAVGLVATFWAFAGIAVLAALIRSRVENLSAP
jgi:predicted MFS family arabinose efflux permease